MVIIRTSGFPRQAQQTGQLRRSHHGNPVVLGKLPALSLSSTTDTYNASWASRASRAAELPQRLDALALGLPAFAANHRCPPFLFEHKIDRAVGASHLEPIPLKRFFHQRGNSRQDIAETASTVSAIRRPRNIFLAPRSDETDDNERKCQRHGIGKVIPMKQDATEQRNTSSSQETDLRRTQQDSEQRILRHLELHSRLYLIH